jgi:transposase
MEVGMAKKYIVTLTEEEREYLHQMLSSGEERVRKLTRARILLKADENWTDEAIHQALDVGISTIERVRRRFVEEGLEAALNRRPSTRRYERLLDGKAEAHLIALACSPPPEGRKHWSLRLLAEKLVALEQVDVDSVSHETVRQVLKKTNLNLGRKSAG